MRRKVIKMMKKVWWRTKKRLIFASTIAGVAQLVERQPSKLNVASSNLVSRSENQKRPWFQYTKSVTFLF